MSQPILEIQEGRNLIQKEKGSRNNSRYGTSSIRSVVALYSATFGYFFFLKINRAQMHHNAHLRTIIEEEELKGNKAKKSGGEFDEALSKNDVLSSLSFHKAEICDLFKELETSQQNGLTTKAAQEKLKICGPNKLKEPEEYHWSVRFLLEMFSMMACILWIGSILSFIGYGLDSSDPSNVFLNSNNCLTF